MSKTPALGINESLAAAARGYARNLKGGGRDGVDHVTPLDAMIAAEESAPEEEMLVRMETVRTWLVWIFSGGPDPQPAMQRLYAMTRAYAPELLLNMSGEKIAAIFGQTRAAESARNKMLLNRTLEHAGFRHGALPFQKSSAACAKFSHAQRGNRNRVKNTAAA